MNIQRRLHSILSLLIILCSTAAYSQSVSIAQPKAGRWVGSPTLDDLTVQTISIIPNISGISIGNITNVDYYYNLGSNNFTPGNGRVLIGNQGAGLSSYQIEWNGQATAVGQGHDSSVWLHIILTHTGGTITTADHQIMLDNEKPRQPPQLTFPALVNNRLINVTWNPLQGLDGEGVEVEGTDVSGIGLHDKSGHRLVTDNNATTQLSREVNKPTLSSTIYLDGDASQPFWIHIRSGDSNRNTNGQNWTDTEHFGPITLDEVPPTVAVTPNNTCVTSAPITFTFAFSETVTGFTPSDVIVTGGTADTSTFTNTVPNTTWTMEVGSPSTTVTVTVPAAIAQDAATNQNTAGAATVTYDASVPTVVLSPLDNAVAVSKTADLVITFSEDIQAGTGNIQLFRTVGNVLVQSFDVQTQVGIVGNVVTIDPTADLDGNTQYHVIVPATAFADNCGNAYAGLTTATDWNFETENSPPVANDDALTTNEDNSTTHNIIVNDTDVDALDTLTVQSTNTTGLLGSVTVATDGSLTYDPNGQFETLDIGETDTDSFTYVVTDGQDTDSATVVITVVGVNDDPIVVAGGNQTTNEGTNVSIAPTFTDADTNDTHTATVDWGDGMTTPINPATSPINTNHTYCDDGIYTVTIVVQDDDGGSASGTLTITVNNVAPTVGAANNGSVDEAAAVTITTTFTDPATCSETHSATIDWGDGSTGTNLSNVSSGFTATHAYCDDGNYTVTVVVTDDEGDSDSDTTTVTVDNVAPTVTAVTNDGPVDENSPVTVSTTFTDPATCSETFTATIDWGDGNTAGPITVTSPFSRTHAYCDDGNYTVTVVVTDDEGDSDSDTTSVTVDNVAPTVTAVTNDGPVDENSPVTVSTTFTDPATCSETFTATIDWGDGNTAGPITVTSPFSQTHAYCDDGNYTVTVVVTDDEGDSDSDTTTVTVDNVAPTVTAVTNDGPVDENSPVTVSTTFTDPATCSETFTATIDWGDGNTAGPITVTSPFSQTHAYCDDGNYTVTVVVTDDEGDSDSDTTTVTVDNVAPTVTAVTNDGPVDENSPVTVSTTFTDPATCSETFTATIDWGDGNTAGPITVTSPFSQTHAYCDDGNYTVTVVVTDDEGDSDSDTTTVTVDNVAPTVTAVTNDGPVDENSPVTVSTTFTDPATCSETFTATIDWGDGNSAGPITVTSPFSRTHAYCDDGNYTVTVVVTDDEGDSDSDTTSVTVDNVAPTVTAVTNDGPVDENSPVTVSTTFTDPATCSETFTATIDWGDGNTAGPITVTSPFSQTHAYCDDGNYTVTVVVTDDEGDSDSDTTTVTVDNVAPTVTAVTNDGPVDENSPVTVSTTFTDPATCSETFTATIDWGDGNSAGPITVTSPFSRTHAYCDDGNYTVTVVVTDDEGDSDSDTTTVTVDNVAPTVTAVTNDGPVDENSPVTVSTTFTDPATCSETFTATIDWGDGNTAGPITVTSPFSQTHAYCDDGNYTVTVVVTDDEGDSDSDTTTVTVDNVAPTVTAVTNDGPVDENSPVTVSTTFTDPATCSETFTATIDWGDGNSAGPITVTSPFSRTHAYCDDGNYTVTVVVTDDEGDSDSDTTTVTVDNVAPTVTAVTNDGPVDENSPVTVSTTFTDPATCSETFTATIDWGDGNSAGPITVTSPFSQTHAYCDDGNYTVTVVVTDDEGDSDSDTTTVTVDNVAPTVTAVTNDGPVDENSPVTVSTTFTDPATCSETFTATIDWGDGNSAGPITVTSPFSRTHAYCDDGNYTVTVVVTDDEGDSDSDTTSVTVDNVAPTVTAVTNDGPVDENSPVTVSTTFTDPATCSETFTATIDWGDGNTAGPITVTSPFSRTHAYCDDGNYTVTVVVTDDEGDSDSDTTTVTVDNVAPTVTAVTNNGPVDENSPVTVSTTFTDPATCSETFTATIDWGDGNSAGPITVTSPFSRTHAYCDDGNYTVTVVVTDDEGDSDSDTTTVTVDNVAPTVTAVTNNGPVDENSPVTVSTTFTDPATCSETFTATIDWGDGNTAGPITVTSPFSQTHAYCDDGNYTVTVVVTDDEGDSDSDTTSVTVDNVAPTVTAVTNDGPVDENSPVTVSTTFTDPATCSETFTATIDWGDGNTAGPITVTSPFSQTHAYCDDGNYTVTVVVTDDEGDSDSDTTTVTVDNVAPTVTAVTNDGPVDENSPVTVSTTFTDPATCSETFTATIDWGDGNTAGPITVTSPFSRTHAYCDDGSYTVTVVVTDDEGGNNSGMTTVTVENVAPTCVDDAFTILEAGTFNTNAGDLLLIAPGASSVLANDSDVGCDTLTIDTTPVTAPTWGALTLATDGSFTYVHDDSENFVDSFVYKTMDGDGGTCTATVNIWIEPVNLIRPDGPGQAVRENNWVTIDISLESPALQTLVFALDYNLGTTETQSYNNKIDSVHASIGANADIIAVEDDSETAVTRLWIGVDGNTSSSSNPPNVGDQAIDVNSVASVVLQVTMRVAVGSPLGDITPTIDPASITAYDLNGQDISSTFSTPPAVTPIIVDTRLNPLDADENGIMDTIDASGLYRASLWGNLRGLVPMIDPNLRTADPRVRATDEEIIANFGALADDVFGPTHSLNFDGLTGATSATNLTYLFRQVLAQLTGAPISTVPAGRLAPPDVTMIETKIDAANVEVDDTFELDFSYSDPEHDTNSIPTAKETLDSTTESVRIRYNESLRASMNARDLFTDANIATAVVSVVNGGAAAVIVTIEEDARVIVVTPVAPWNSGPVTITIDRTQLFDVEGIQGTGGADVIEVFAP